MRRCECGRGLAGRVSRGVSFTDRSNREAEARLKRAIIEAYLEADGLQGCKSAVDGTLEKGSDKTCFGSLGNNCDSVSQLLPILLWNNGNQKARCGDGEHRGLNGPKACFDTVSAFGDQPLGQRDTMSKIHCSPSLGLFPSSSYRLLACVSVRACVSGAPTVGCSACRRLGLSCDWACCVGRFSSPCSPCGRLVGLLFACAARASGASALSWTVPIRPVACLVPVQPGMPARVLARSSPRLRNLHRELESGCPPVSASARISRALAVTSASSSAWTNRVP